jgi:hypothetical protein
MVMINQKQLFFLTVDLGYQSSLDTLLVLATCTDEGQEFLIFDLENRPGDLGRFKRFEFKLFLLATGGHDHFDRLDFISATDKFLEVNGQGLFVFVVSPFKVGRRARIEMGDVPSVRTVLGMVMASMVILFVRLAVAMVMIVIMVVSRALGTRSLLGSLVLGGIAAHPNRNTENQGQCDPFRDFHSEFSLLFLVRLGNRSVLTAPSCKTLLQSVCVLYALCPLWFVIEAISDAILFGNLGRLGSARRRLDRGGKTGISTRFHAGTFHRYFAPRLFLELRNCEPAFRRFRHRHR